MSRIAQAPRTCLLGLLVACAGCASASIARYPGMSYPPTKPDAVVLYHNTPPVAFQRIGEVNYEVSGSQSDWPGPEHYLRVQAAKLGGDAVIIQSEERPYEGTDVTSGGIINRPGNRTEVRWPTVTNRYGHVVRGVVIKFIDAGGSSGAVAPAAKVKFCPLCGNRWAADAKTTHCPLDGTPLKDQEPIR